MSLQRTRRAAAALALATTLGLGAPVHAAGWEGLAVTPGWLEQALEWIARFWTEGSDAAEPKPVPAKCGAAIDPNGSPLCQSSTPSTPGTEDGSGPNE